MSRPSTGHQNLLGIRDGGTGEAATWREHRGKAFPGEIMEIETKSGGSRRGAIHRKGSGVEKGASEYIEVRTDGNRGEVTEAIDMGVTGHEGERAPSEGGGVKEERGVYGRVLREDTEEVREVTVVTAERDESFGGKEEFP